MNYIRKRTNNRYNYYGDPCPSICMDSFGTAVTVGMSSLGWLITADGEYVLMPDPRSGSSVRTNSKKLPKAWRVS